MQIVLHQSQHQIGDFKQIFHDLQLVISNRPHGLIVFPELFLTGYPLQDLVLQKEFIHRYLDAFEQFEIWLKEQPALKETTILVGGLHYQFDEQGLPLPVANVVFEAKSGVGMEILYTKCLLPNYDIFDEEKYFAPGTEAAIIERSGKRMGLLICEDMWFSSTHDIDPVQLLEEKAKEEGDLDIIVNLSASPYFLGKKQKRIERAKEISKRFNVPFLYVNQVGGEDEILFDGQSFIVASEGVIKAKAFEEDILSWNFQAGGYDSAPTSKNKNLENQKSPIDNSWESLFRADFLPCEQKTKTLPRLTSWGERECEEIIQALSFGLQEYAGKCGFKKFLVALSGGIDSGLVLCLAKLALKEGQSLEAIYMPSLYSSPLSTQLSEELCQNLAVPLHHFPIKFLHSAVNQEFQRNLGAPLEGLANENIQSRLRGSLLYAHSNQSGAMVINTSNKSELAVGYSTLYGDSVGAISLLGDLYKSQVYDLSNYLHQRDGLLPKAYIERPPTAELRENQEDSQSLPPYERLDPMLEGILSYRYSCADLVDLGFKENEVKKVYDLYVKSEYKRNQFCPILKVKAKSFGFGYRMPITKKS